MHVTIGCDVRVAMHRKEGERGGAWSEFAGKMQYQSYMALGGSWSQEGKHLLRCCVAKA